METLQISSEPDAYPEDVAVIETGLNQFNLTVSSIRDYRPVAIFLRDAAGTIHGGLIGNMWGGCLHIKNLWITERLRHQGYGSRLLRSAEEEGGAANCRGAFLDTFSLLLKVTARFIVLLMLAASLAVSVAASAEPAQPSTALVAWLQQHMRRYGIPGASVAVMKNYRIEWARGFGLRNKESKTAVTRDTLFQAASVSKAFTATAAMIAFDRKKLSIDADINDVFRSFHPYPDVGPWLLPNEYHPARPVTLRLLLSHAGGTNDFHYSGYRYGYYDEPPHSIERIPTMHEELDGLPPAKTPPIAVSKERAPGAYWAYSPAGFTVVQAALMDIYDAPFSTIMDNLLLSPLQMRDSTFVQPTPQVLVSRMAVPYLTDGRRLSDGPRVFNTEASGGLTTTPTDLAKFVIAFQKALAGEAQGGITPSIAAQMMQRQNRPVWKCSPPATDSGKRFCDAPDGLGFDVNLTKRFEHQPDGEPTGGYFAHTGFNSGYLSLMMGSKSSGNGIVIMINVSPEDMSTSQIPEYTFLTDLVARVAEEEGWT